MSSPILCVPASAAVASAASAAAAAPVSAAAVLATPAGTSTVAKPPFDCFDIVDAMFCLPYSYDQEYADYLPFMNIIADYLVLPRIR